MLDCVRRFELRSGRHMKWCNLVLQAMKMTKVIGNIGSGPPRVWSGSAKETVKEFATTENAVAAFEKEIKVLVSKGFQELLPPKAAKERGKSSTGDVWARLERWFHEHAPHNCEFPLAAANESKDLARFEKQLGQRLPADFRTAYRRHNGSNGVWIFNVLGLGYWMPLYPLGKRANIRRSTADDWQCMAEMYAAGSFEGCESSDKPKGPIKAQHWNPGWVPFSCDDSGDSLCIDLDPPRGGKRGQVIFWWHEYGPYAVVADSFGALIERLVFKLEKGAYAFSESGELLPTQPVERSFRALLAYFKKGKAK